MQSVKEGNPNSKIFLQQAKRLMGTRIIIDLQGRSRSRVGDLHSYRRDRSWVNETASG